MLTARGLRDSRRRGPRDETPGPRPKWHNEMHNSHLYLAINLTIFDTLYDYMFNLSLFYIYLYNHISLFDYIFDIFYAITLAQKTGGGPWWFSQDMCKSTGQAKTQDPRSPSTRAGKYIENNLRPNCITNAVLVSLCRTFAS